MKRLHWATVLLIAFVTLRTQELVHAQEFVTSPASRIHPQFSKLRADERVDVMVLHRAEAPEGAGERIQSRTGLNLHHHFENVRQSAGRLTRSEIERLANDPEVEFIAPDSPVKAFGLDRGPESIGAYAAYAAGQTGNGVGVAVIDSGITYSNCDYSYQCKTDNRFLGQMSFVTSLDGTSTAPNDGQDYFGHGSHVASILAGSGVFSTSYIDSWGITPTYWIHGVAAGANVISLRVLDSKGSGTDSMVIAAIDWAISNKESMNIRVINLSLGRPFTVSYKKDPLCQAAEQAWKAGIVVVVAAGNYGRSSPATEGYGTITAPGNDPLVITVGAVNTRGTTNIEDHVVASYSSKGPTAIDHIAKPDLVAPGNKIYATQCQSCPLIASYPANKVPDTDYASVPAGWSPASSWYFTLSGTSMATPMVAGAAAILIAEHPSLTPDQVKARLMKT
ncbi:MAG: S8 family serine peptidase, partial [Terriglobales bacterium]